MKKFYSLRREYKGKPILDENISRDPLNQFNIWFQEAVTKYDNQENIDPNAMVLSTSNKENKISSRVVLMKSYSFKGFIFFGHYESQKGRDMQENNLAHLLFYWPYLFRQVRIQGMTKKLSAKESDNYFKSRPRGAQIAASVAKQSHEIQSRSELKHAYERLEKDSQGEEILRPDNWGGWILKPNKMEFWQGMENRMHDRVEYYLFNKKWLIRRLAP